MATRTDHIIIAVRYEKQNLQRVHIDAVKARPDLGATLGKEAVWQREHVVRAIAQGTTFATVYCRDGQWRFGASVGVITVDGTKFLRTDADRTRKDNLQELPEF